MIHHFAMVLVPITMVGFVLMKENGIDEGTMTPSIICAFA
jgi:hypothetical protein